MNGERSIQFIVTTGMPTGTEVIVAFLQSEDAALVRASREAMESPRETFTVWARWAEVTAQDVFPNPNKKEVVS